MPSSSAVERLEGFQKLSQQRDRAKLNFCRVRTKHRDTRRSLRKHLHGRTLYQRWHVFSDLLNRRAVFRGTPQVREADDLTVVFTLSSNKPILLKMARRMRRMFGF